MEYWSVEKKDLHPFVITPILRNYLKLKVTMTDYLHLAYKSVNLSIINSATKLVIPVAVERSAGHAVKL